MVSQVQRWGLDLVSEAMENIYDIAGDVLRMPLGNGVFSGLIPVFTLESPSSAIHYISE